MQVTGGKGPYPLLLAPWWYWATRAQPSSSSAPWYIPGLLGSPSVIIDHFRASSPISMREQHTAGSSSSAAMDQSSMESQERCWLHSSHHPDDRVQVS